MSTLLPFLVLFIIALAIGIFMGKMLFSAKSQSEKIFLEEKLNDFKTQSLAEKTTLEKQLQQILQE
ncbi:MAG TPA: DNA recombination protein RmuC, partial [Flavobacterium sp.]|nr:DNA recombination protein RmuC [Flavobacterium sp.]